MGSFLKRLWDSINKKEDDSIFEVNQHFYCTNEQFRIIDVANEDNALLFVKELIDEGYPDEQIHVELRQEDNTCKNISIDYGDNRDENCMTVARLAIKYGLFWDE